ncbi:hypothetical protein CYY_008352 [Polysphondylium violaceum]|uniref:Uncharacterized protein n=1 Tax=Polysphondylium violaceum TaxID=133409 RepID=A0A8J4UX06_9MYCE|nr:hypothetical protein CYY_008352 [Polysphondylium violaceum]
MIIKRYREVFSNRYLTTYIFNKVREIQRDRYPQKYNDIVDVGWMLKYGHVGLAKEKIKNKEYTYVEPQDLFSIVANTDTQIFVYMFEKYKYYALRYCGLTKLKEIIGQLKNQQVILYLFENGYARETEKDKQPMPIIEHWFKSTDRVESIWSTCIDQGEQAFFDMWQTLSSRIRITVNGNNCCAHFHPFRDITDEDDVNVLAKDKLVIDIAPIIAKKACIAKSLKILGFLMDTGFEQNVYNALNNYNYYSFFNYQMTKTFSEEECRIVVKILRSNTHWIEDALGSSCYYGNPDYFNSLYQLSKEHYPVVNVPLLFRMTVNSENYHMMAVLESHGLFFSKHIDINELLDLCHDFPRAFTHLLEYIDLGITNTITEKERTDVCTTFLEHAIRHNDYIAVKYIFNKHKFESLDQSVLKQLSRLENLVIIDYINKHRALCFTPETVLNNNYFHTLFGDLFNQVSLIKTTPLNIPLIEYLVKESCIDLKQLNSKIEVKPFFNRDSGSDIQPQRYYFCEIVYLIDHNNYLSIDPFIQVFTNDLNSLEYLEYIHRNQHKFQTKPSFQSIFDNIIINVNGNNIIKSIGILKTLIDRYGCVPSDKDKHMLSSFRKCLDQKLSNKIK